MRTDDELIRDFVDRAEAGAFDELVRRHLALIRRLLYGILGGNEEDILDAQQEVLVALYRCLPRFAGRSTFRTWLYRFVKNRGIDYLRRITRLKAKDKQIARTQTALSEAVEEDPADGVILNERRREVSEALLELRREDRLLLIMREVDGMALGEIARSLRVPTGTVKSRLHRARDRFEHVLRLRGVTHET